MKSHLAQRRWTHFPLSPICSAKLKQSVTLNDTSGEKKIKLFVPKNSPVGCDTHHCGLLHPRMPPISRNQHFLKLFSKHSTNILTWFKIKLYCNSQVSWLPWDVSRSSRQFRMWWKMKAVAETLPDVAWTDEFTCIFLCCPSQTGCKCFFLHSVIFYN